MDHPVLRGELVVIRPITADDHARLREILVEPEVARWWGTTDPDGLVDELNTDPEEVSLAVEFDGSVIGMVQYAEESDPSYRHAGIDIFLTSHLHGRGLGGDAVRTVARFLIEERGHHRLTIDPAASNARAIAAYARVGFKPVGVMRNYERGRDGSWHDGLLMDLLAGELLPPTRGGDRKARVDEKG